MKLKKVVIEGFKSIKNKQILHLDKSVTILIGPNDHGKTNLLQAVKFLNKDANFAEADRNWDVDPGDTTKPKIEYFFELLDHEKKELSSLMDSLPATGEEKPQTMELDISEVVFVREGLGKPLELVVDSGLKNDAKISSYLMSIVPRVELFSPESSRLQDAINLNELKAQNSEFMQGIFRKAGLWDSKETLFAQNTTTDKKLADASEKLTEVIRGEWEQGKNLKFLLTHSGTNGNSIILQIKDPAVSERYVMPSQRSSGFSSFFVLSLALYAREQANKSNTYIFLFDEPGTYLHPQGQVNLQRVFESFGLRNQIVYSTHSIFLISKNHPTRNKVVIKNNSGTLLDQKPYLNNWKSVRTSLGLFLSNNFFFADSTLLTEGPSDVIYVFSILRTAISLGQIDIDLNLFSVRDCGNVVDYSAMAKLMVDEGRGIVGMIDGDDGGNSIGKKLDKINDGLPGENKIKKFQLREKHSIENYLPYPGVLKKAFVNACKSLVLSGDRVYAEGIDENSIENLLSEELAKDSDTLGKKLELVSKKLFNPPEKISKLLIAHFYEDLVESERANSTLESPQNIELYVEFCTKLKNFLNLKSSFGEKAIFEE